MGRKDRRRKALVHKQRIKLFRNTFIHRRMLAWYRKACFYGLERGEGLPYNNEVKKQLERQIERVCVELPAQVLDEIEHPRPPPRED